MAGSRVIAICICGGEFQSENDGSLIYKGGDAHAIDVDNQMKFTDFKNEAAEMFNCNVGLITLKYFLPGNKKTLITISNDKDLKRMIKFYAKAETADVYIIIEEPATPDVSSMPVSRSSRTTLSEAVLPIVPSLNLVDDMMDDTNTLGDTLGVIMDDTNQVVANINIPAAISSINPFDIVKINDYCQDTITGVGQRFNTVHEFRECLRRYAMANQFAFRYKKNDSHRVTVKCKAEGCPWRIHASRLSTTQLICIKKMTPTHTCEGAFVTTGHQASRGWVASIIKEKLKVFPNYKAKDIVKDVKEEYGIQLKYFQAWRGKEIAKVQLQGSYREAYNQLPIFCEKIMETNPGSLATFTTKEDSSFHRLFIAFHASLYGFLQGCRPLLFLDSIPLKSKYQDTLLAATAADGEDRVFPVAFAIVDAETDGNWRWFLTQLKTALPTTASITFVADRQKGLRESIAEIFQDSFHAYCLRYLTEQLIRDLKGQVSHEVKRLMVEDFYSAAYAPRPEGFQRYLENIKGISLEAYNWLMRNSQPEHWANAYFLGARYNHVTSNFGDLFYGWVAEATELPITQLVDVIRGKIVELIDERRADSDQWTRRMTPTVEDKLQQEGLESRSLQVVMLSENEFQVRGDSFDKIDLNHWACSCQNWQLSGLPCRHAIAVFSCIGRSPYDFCSRFFTSDNYRLTYSQSVHPIPSVIDRRLQNDSSQSAVTVTPPPTRRPPGRPTSKKTGSEEVRKRQLQCSRCKGTGHNKSTCKECL